MKDAFIVSSFCITCRLIAMFDAILLNLEYSLFDILIWFWLRTRLAKIIMSWRRVRFIMQQLYLKALKYEE